MKLQHNYTNKEQALRLKVAGLPAETADCMLTCSPEDYGTSDLVTLISEKGEPGENWDFFMDESAFPCWSLGRLIELSTYLLEDVNRNQHPINPLFLKVEHTDNMVEDMVKWFERFAEIYDNAFESILPDKPKPKPEAKRVENCAIRYFGSKCPLDPKMEVDQYNCVNCEHYFCTSTKSIICKHVEKEA